MIPVVIPYPVSIEKKDVNFYDYDGTLLYSYTTAQAQALSALPAPPDHSGNEVPLTFQEWNYTLAQVNATTKALDIGATYIPTDGKTHFIIRVTAVTGGSVPFLFKKSNATDTLSIDYGDGQTDSNSADASVKFTPATALSVGDHEVTVWLSSGEGTYSLGQGADGTQVVGGATQNFHSTLFCCYIGEKATSIGAYAFQSCYSLTSISVPSGVTSIGTYAFSNCYSLASISIPSGVTSIGVGTFSECNSLASISIPSGVTSIGTYAFQKCYSLTSISVPSGVTSIGDYAFQGCYSLTSISVPSGVTSIGDYAFSNCYSLASISIPSGVTSIGICAFQKCYPILEYNFFAFTAVPTLSNTSAFTNINAACVMKIPSALYTAWSTATNWSTYAAYMVEV